jgi:protein-disulfide isomerase
VKPSIEQQYVQTGKLVFVWRDFPWIGEESRQAAQAARCAGDQGRFWEMHDLLYASQRGYNQGQFSAANLKAFGVRLGLDATAFNACVDAGADLPALHEEFQAGRARGIAATPYFLLNGRPVAGGTFARLAAAFDAELQRLGG